MLLSLLWYFQLVAYFSKKGFNPILHGVFDLHIIHVEGGGAKMPSYLIPKPKNQVFGHQFLCVIIFGFGSSLDHDPIKRADNIKFENLLHPITIIC